eukprot:gene13316-9152_t
MTAVTADRLSFLFFVFLRFSQKREKFAPLPVPRQHRKGCINLGSDAQASEPPPPPPPPTALLFLFSPPAFVVSLLFTNTMNPLLLSDAAARSTVRLHESAAEYLTMRRAAMDHMAQLDYYNEHLRAATGALVAEDQRLQRHLSATQQVQGLVKELTSNNQDPIEIEVHQQALQCEQPEHMKVLQLKAEVLAEESVLDLLTQRMSKGGFDSVEEFLKDSLESGRRIFFSKFLMHRLQRQLHIPFEEPAPAPSPAPASALTSSPAKAPAVLSATAASPPKPAPPVPKRLPPKAALRASFPRASDKMIDKALASAGNNMSAARKKLKELCDERREAHVVSCPCRMRLVNPNPNPVRLSISPMPPRCIPTQEEKDTPLPLTATTGGRTHIATRMSVSIASDGSLSTHRTGHGAYQLLSASIHPPPSAKQSFRRASRGRSADAVASRSQLAAESSGALNELRSTRVVVHHREANTNAAGDVEAAGSRPRRGSRRRSRQSSLPFPSAASGIPVSGEQVCSEGSDQVPLPPYRRRSRSHSLGEADLRRRSRGEKSSTRAGKADEALQGARREVDQLVACVQAGPFESVRMNGTEVRSDVGRPPLYGASIEVDESPGKVVRLAGGRRRLKDPPTPSTSSTEMKVDEALTPQHKRHRRHRRSSSRRQAVGAGPPPQTETAIAPGTFVAAFARRCVRTAAEVAPPPLVPLLRDHSGLSTLGSTTMSGPPSAAPQRESLRGVLSVTVRGMSPLPADASVVHPFVRVWVLDCQTGRNLLGEGRHTQCGITQPFDLRMRATRCPWWEADLPLPLDGDACDDAARRAMVLFEVCDAGNESIYGTYIPRQGLQRLCWGFFMLYDTEGRLQLPRENFHVQLYPFPSETAWYTRLLQQFLPNGFASSAVFAPATEALDVGGTISRGGEVPEAVAQRQLGLLRAPEVFRVFQDPTSRKVCFRGGLVASARLSADPQPVRPALLVYEEYLLNLLLKSGLATVSPLPPPLDTTEDEEAGPFVATTSYVPGRTGSGPNFSREPGERALLPTHLVGTFLVEGRVTCMSLSHGGTVLAAGVTVNMSYEVQIRDSLSPSFECVRKLKGHTAHIHAVVFNRKDSLLVSCSADMTARVWKPSPRRDEDERTAAHFAATRCVLVLPHAFPVYGAVFHQDHVVTCGCSPLLLAWKCDASLTTPSTSSSSTPRSFTDGSQLTASFTPGSPFGDSAMSSSTPAPPGAAIASQIVSKVSNEADTVILSISAAAKGNHIWSISSSGKVTCWRAVNERREKGASERVWQMSARRSLSCSGGTHIACDGKYVLVTCAKLPLSYIVEYATGQQLFAVPTRLPPDRPFHLLPDGDAFVAGAADGTLQAWECIDAGVCTPSGGYQKLRIPHDIRSISWATDRHLCAFGSEAPLPQDSALLQQRAGLQPVERTAITIAGTVRHSASIVLSSGASAAEEFSRACGSLLSSKRRAAVTVAKTKERSRTRLMDKDRDTRLYDHKDTVLEFSEQVSLKQEERYNRMDFILNFWKGLTKQHRHRASGADEEDAEKTRVPDRRTRDALQTYMAAGDD